MKQIIEDLYKLNRLPLGEGFDSALAYINALIPLTELTFASGTTFDTWTVPDEWIVRDAWVKFKGEKILDYTKNPLCLVQYSRPFSGTLTSLELQEHLHVSDDQVDAFSYESTTYKANWGFTIPKADIFTKNEFGSWVNNLEEGEYEVFVDTELRPGTMKVGVHTIPGKSDREILLFAHLDHPYQANSNLSGVACLVDLAKKITCDHTVKLVFCPKTIGSIAYAYTQDLSKVDFMIAVDSVGNDNPEGVVLQKAFNREARINHAAHLSLRGLGEGYRQGIFRSLVESDEYAFNDPTYGIPGILLSTMPYAEYHTSNDTPERISYKAIEHVQKAIIKTIEYYERDFIPERAFRGPLFRTRYRIQTPGRQLNLSWDYFFYSIDGKRSFAELCVEYGLNFEYAIEKLQPLIDEGLISCRPHDRQGNVKKTPRKKS